MADCGPGEVVVAGRILRPGNRVRLKPEAGKDIIDTMLAGRIGIIECIDQDESGAIHVAVILADDPGREFGDIRHPTHRFFFRPFELEPTDQPGQDASERRVLVAGIGNIFFGDDGFGVEVVRYLAGCDLPAGTEVIDFGIRGMDLAYSLVQPYHAAIMVDVVPRGAVPGTIHLLRPEPNEFLGEADPHRMHPMAVLGLASQLGPLPAQVILVGCEPQSSANGETMTVGLSKPVAAAVARAADTVIEIARGFLRGGVPMGTEMRSIKNGNPQDG